MSFKIERLKGHPKLRGKVVIEIERLRGGIRCPPF
jgi:hypothetical protein